jgi:hypothetical protein
MNDAENIELKGSLPKIETGCGWYGYVDLYLERCCGGFIIFSVALSSSIQIKVLPAGLQRLVDVDSHITSGDRMQTLS